MPDARVQAAIDNWAPRFTTNGVDPNDFRTTTARIERWDEWLDAWCETGFALDIRADYEAAVGAILDAVSARGQGDVDLERVGAAGVSLGGYYAPRAAKSYGPLMPATARSRFSNAAARGA